VTLSPHVPESVRVALQAVAAPPEPEAPTEPAPEPAPEGAVPAQPPSGDEDAGANGQ